MPIDNAKDAEICKLCHILHELSHLNSQAVLAYHSPATERKKRGTVIVQQPYNAGSDIRLPNNPLGTTIRWLDSTGRTPACPSSCMHSCASRRAMTRLLF